MLFDTIFQPLFDFFLHLVKAIRDDSVTDDGMVMETYGIRGVRMIKGSYENMKITTPEDMLLGEAILKGRSTER